MMIPEEYIDILEREAKGRATKSDLDRLGTYLGEHPELKEEFGATAAVLKRLQAVPQHPPPTVLRDRVMNELENSNIYGKVKTMKLATVMPASRMQWVMAASVVVVTFVIGFIVGYYPPPTAEQMQGTMGGAEKATKYQSMQMMENDVVMTKTDVQELMQNDVMQKMIASGEMKSAFANQGFVAAFYGGELQHVLSNPSMHQALQDNMFAVQFWATLPALFGVGGNGGVGGVGGVGANLQAVRENPEFMKLLSNPSFAKACQNEKFLPALVSQNMQAVLANPGMVAAMKLQSVRSAVASYSFLSMLSSPEARGQFAQQLQAVQGVQNVRGVQGVGGQAQ